MQSTSLYIYDDVANSQDDFHLLGERVNVRDMRFLYSETYVINAPSGAGDGYTASSFSIREREKLELTDRLKEAHHVKEMLKTSENHSRPVGIWIKIYLNPK